MKLASAALAIFAILPSTNAGLRGITNEKDDLHAQPNVFSSKNNGNGSDGNGNGNNESNIGNRPGKPDTVPTEQGNNSKPNGPNGNAFGHSTSKGQIILGGGKGQGKGLGTIDNSSVLAAQEGGKRVLQSLSKNGDKQKFKAKNSNTKHLRFTQEVHGMEVEGAALFVHTDDLGEVIGINGELVDGETVPSEPTLDAAVSMKTALKEALIPEEAHAQCNEPTTLAVVRGLEDGKAYLAWTCTAQYNTVDKDGVVSPNSDKIFARATGEPGLIQSHPEIYGASPSIQTYNCNNLSENNIIQGATCEALVSSSSSKISSGDAAATAAHNHAIDTFEYYSSKFGRNSIDANGMTIRSSVHVGTNYVNAFWYRNQMWYGDGQAGVSKALSLDLDVVAHELTHGVTERTSGLIYQNESGALNEAMSDIMAAFVEQANGADDRSTWLVGEDIWESGEALRSMCDPSAMGDYDYYPTRYTGASDNGGVHWNSGIANLAACLLVKGGTHPRGKTSTDVTGVGFDVAADIFYNANVNCLTPSANFEQARFCTADIYGGAATESVHAAWDAVGVVDNVASYDSTLGVPKCSTAGQSCRSGDLLNGVSTASETNNPNTLDGCQDGIYGTHLYDESVEAVEVSAVGGMNELLKVGSKAVVKATVYAWSTGSGDTADFYYAENVSSNPNWKLIGSVPAQKGGYHTLTSPEFTIPDADQVAVRAVFRYVGSQSPCPGGPYDDVDDLVFAVGRDGACVDTPGWTDSYGDGCEWYVAHDDPGCPKYGNSWGTALGTPNEACCYCGGGQ